MENMGSYTQNMYDSAINAVGEGYDIDYDYSELLELINSQDYFLPFSERLLRDISRRQGIMNCTPEEAYLLLYNKMKDAGISPNRNTIKNWLNVSGAPEGNCGPNMGDAGREAMFQAAFALGLNAEETEDFFHRVYLDKAFNARNAREFVYFYCFLRGKPYSEAQTLAAKAEQILASDPNSGEAANTMLIKSAAQNAADDDELLAYIGEHAYSFTKKNETALAEQNRLLKDLRGGDGQTGLAEQEYTSAYRDADITGSEGRNLHSVDFVLDMAVNGPDFIEKAVGGTGVKRVREILPRKEISNQFPNANNISHPDSSYILRKNIIFLYFYWYWVKDKMKAYPEGDKESFFTELDNILYRCGFGPLYYGNPYDWLFLYCAACKDNESRPLDVFREILEKDEDEMVL